MQELQWLKSDENMSFLLTFAYKNTIFDKIPLKLQFSPVLENTTGPSSHGAHWERSNMM